MKMKQMTMDLCLATVCLSMAGVALAGNPILRETDPGFIYACDPSAEVFNGKVYVYCSHDQPDAVNYESMKDYAILESSDLKTWINHGVCLDPQLDPGFEYYKSNMNAPDAAYKDGWYYWYFPGNIIEVGVAKSRTPIGPWEHAADHIASIFDPTVFVDDDGQAYIYGNDTTIKDLGDPGRHVLGAKLKDNMIELDGPLMRLTEERVNEAVHVFKRNGIYYFCGRVGRITGYWMADSPLPHYATYKGEFAPDSPESPNHTSVIEFNGEWYLFYHRGDVNHGNKNRRSACFDKLTFREDGTVEPVVYTLDDGVEVTVPERRRRGDKKAAQQSPSTSTTAVQSVSSVGGAVRREAEAFDECSGTKVEDQTDGQDCRGLGYIKNGDWTRYDQLDFGSNKAGKISFRVRVAAPKKGGSIELRLDRLDGTVIATIPVSETAGWSTFETLTTTLSGIHGIQTLYLCYVGGSENLMNLNWFEWIPLQKSSTQE